MRTGFGWRVAVAALILLATAAPLYVIWDNGRVVVVEQEITMERLPDPFDGFTILHITDLHSKRFGPQQARLLRRIDALEYDAVAITGDMINYRDRCLEPFYELLAGIEGTVPILFARGNTDPRDYDPFTGEVRAFGEELQRRGVTLLNRPFGVTREGATLWFTAWHDVATLEHILERLQEELIRTSPEGERRTALENEVAYLEGLQTFWAEVDPEDLKIVLTHYPLSRQYRERVRQPPDPHYDLFIAGHYHGGQIRIPLLGATYVPDATGSRMGFFPDQGEVSGLMGPPHAQQVVSRGLGASDVLPLLGFRLFNPPEINLLRLRVPHR